MGANTLILNNTHVVGNNNNTYKFKFPAGNFSVEEGSEICISQMTLPYSWFNITAALGNNAIGFAWVDSGGTTYLTCTFPDGFYTVETLNKFYQQYLIGRGQYLINADGKYVFYTEFVTDTLTSMVYFNTYTVPSSLP